MENINKQIDKLNCILHGNGSTYSVYPYNKYSIQEVICEVVTKINEVIDIVEEYTAMVKSLLEWIQDEGIAVEVKSYLDEMLLDGRLSDIINVVLFDEINTKLAELDNKLTLELAKTDLLVKEVIENIELITSTNLNINFFEGATKEHKLINMIDFACSNNFKKVFIPTGVYVITDTILLPESFNKIIIEGENTQETIFQYLHMYNKPCLKVKGGSGKLSMGHIKNITFIGNTTTTAIECNNVCGYKVKNCKFETNKRGIHFVNEDSGFTEFVVGVDCDFTEECITSIEYTKLGSQVSFHGSGLQNCTINQSGESSESNIIIGSGCLPYNAPLDIRVWTRGTTAFIKNYGSENTNFYGNICVEPFTTTPVVFAREQRISYLGGFVSHSQNIKLGSLVQCSRIQLNNDGSLTTHRLPINETIIINSNDTYISHLSDGETVLLDVVFSAVNYEYHYTVLFAKWVGSDDGTATILATHREFNSAGLGEPYFMVVGGKICINNGNFTGKEVNCKYTMTQLGGRYQFHME